ncbi:9097_t:CDS:2 [Paraglomus occultum]|uniref:9097_t:CDS:1 n=1 Tax=Paraglomus occultum TaxID=144539 RepID=A0A9N8W171_9GLOM|nr:9097_t:CDS:2 [Paraglomus occultum]
MSAGVALLVHVVFTLLCYLQFLVFETPLLDGCYVNPFPGRPLKV